MFRSKARSIIAMRSYILLSMHRTMVRSCYILLNSGVVCEYRLAFGCVVRSYFFADYSNPAYVINLLRYRNGSQINLDKVRRSVKKNFFSYFVLAKYF